MKRTATIIGLALLLGALPRARAAEGPARILILGDSMMRVPSHSIELEFSRHEGVTTRLFTSLGSGLARLDVVDWIERIRALVPEFQPDTSIIWIGTNDEQPMRTPAGIIRPEQPGWSEEYARRVGEAMDLLGRGGEAKVYWLELPDMPKPEIQKSADRINGLVDQEAAKRPFVIHYKTRSFLSRTPGTFSRYVLRPNGMPLSVRDTDGVHLDRNGADLLARKLAETFWPTATAAAEK